jgi:DNA helicase-2/ATP-dependent DNA helicase PcrA
MSDASVSAALRSAAKLVVVEAPAGCGKTYQGASYARDIADSVGSGRVLILTHTHAACSVFHSRRLGLGSHVEIRTIDSLISELADAYRQGIGAG